MPYGWLPLPEGEDKLQHPVTYAKNSKQVTTYCLKLRAEVGNRTAAAVNVTCAGKTEVVT